MNPTQAIQFTTPQVATRFISPSTSSLDVEGIIKAFDVPSAEIDLADFRPFIDSAGKLVTSIGIERGEGKARVFYGGETDQMELEYPGEPINRQEAQLKYVKNALKISTVIQFSEKGKPWRVGTQERGALIMPLLG